MSFIPRIKPRDQYLRNFFQQESEDPMANLLNEGDPYDPISPERIVEMRETKSKKEIPFWESFKHYSGIGPAGQLLSKLNFDQLFPKAQEGAIELGQEIGPPSDPTRGKIEERLPYFPGPLSGLAGQRPSEVESRIRGFGQGVAENVLPNINLLDFAPAGRAAKYATALGNIADTEKLARSAGALQRLGKGLETTEKVSGGLQSLGSTGGVLQGVEDISEGNYARGAAQLAGGVAGAALGARSTLDNWTSPENIETAYNELGQLFPVEGMTSNILSHGRYQRPGEVEPVNPKLIERSELPFQESNRQFLENESMQDLFDFTRRAMDVSKRSAEPFVPEIGGELEGITFDRGVRGGNLEGNIRLNTELIARESPDFESYLPKLAEVGTHEVVHEKGKRPHGYAVVENAAQRVARSENPNEADIELGQTQMAMPESMENTETILEDIANSKTRPFEDPEGNYVPEPTDADFSFRTANEAAQNAARLPIEELIKNYLENPNDRATLEHAYLMQRGERPRGSSYRDYTDEAVGLSEVGPVESIEAQGPENEQRVFHGTPYEFDKFSDDAIGSGEGAQAFGHGHYFAEKPELARWYGESVAGNKMGDDLSIDSAKAAAYRTYKSSSNNRYQAISDTKSYISSLNKQIGDIGNSIHKNEGNAALLLQLRDNLEGLRGIRDISIGALKHLEQNTFYPEHNLLSVEIPDEGYIELDKPLAEQHPNVQAGLPQYNKALRRDDHLVKVVHDIESALPTIKEVFDRSPGKGNEFLGDKVERLEEAINNYKENGSRDSISEIYFQLSQLKGRALLDKKPIHKDLQLLHNELDKYLDTFTSSIREKPISEWAETPEQIQQFKEAGIKGIKFKDRQSRYSDTEKPTHNYVIFDPEDAKIVNKRQNLTEAELDALEKKYGRENLSKNVQSFFEGQPVEIIRRNKDRILIKLPDGTEKIVHPNKIKLGVERSEPKSEPKGQYEDITSKLEALEKELEGVKGSEPKSKGIGKELIGSQLIDDVRNRLDYPKSFTDELSPEEWPSYMREDPKHITEQLADLEQELTLSPEDVSVVAEDKHIFPEYATPNKPGRPGKQGPQLQQSRPIISGAQVYPLTMERSDIISSIANQINNTIDKQHHQSTRDAVSNAIQRGIETIQQESGKLANSPYDISVSIQRINPDKIVTRGDVSYNHEKLTEVVQSGMDLVPVNIGKQDGTYYLQDGHHRLRAYQDAGKPVYALVTELIPNKGGKKQIVFNKAQGPPKPPRELLEDVGEEGEGKKQEEDWLKTAAREVPKIERAQAGEIIKDQSFRDQIRLQDQLLKAQELEALKAGDAEEAQKIAMERKILRAQNAEEFSQYKKQQKEQTQKEREQLKLREKILKGQTKEDLELRKQKESFVGKGEDQGSPKGLGETLIDIWRVPAALKSSLDIPALSHTLTDTLSHPIEAARNIKEAGKAAFSPEHQERILTEISQRKNFKNYEKAGLQFTKQGYDPGAQTFGSYTAEKIPGVKASERAQNVFLDKRRADLYDTLTKDMGSFDSDPYGHKKVAELVNAATGYGKLKSQTGEKIVTGLNQVMWSARLRLSRLNHLKLLGEAFVNPKMPASARKEIFKQASVTVGLGIGLLKLAEMAGAEVDLDPRSSKFARAMWKQEDGKVISWNPFAAYTPVVKLASQELTGTKITDKGEVDLTENKPFQSDRASILLDYGYSGLNPSAKVIADALSSKTEMDVSPLLSEEMTDENPNLSKALELVTPINVGNQKQLYNELGPVSALFAPLTSIGSNIDVYDPEKFKKQRERAMRERGEEPKKKKEKRTGKVLSSY